MKREIRDLFYSLVPRNSYLQFYPGNSNVLISAPHGGGMKPIDIPRRKYGQRLMDTYTRRLSHRLYELFNGTKIVPTFVISDIHRSRVDLNRDIVEGAQGNLKAEKIWKDWDASIRESQEILLSNFDRVLYIDLHSHDDGDYFELGYNLSASNYNRLEETKKTGASTTIDSLSGTKYDMIFGDYSLKAGLEDSGFEVYKPNNKDVYFNGGRNVEVYSGNGVGAIQIECPVSILENNLTVVAYALYDSIIRFAYRFVN